MNIAILYRVEQDIPVIEAGFPLMNRILAMKRVEMRTQGNPVFITSNGFAVKGVFESKKSMPDNGTLFCRKRIAIGALWIF